MVNLSNMIWIWMYRYIGYSPMDKPTVPSDPIGGSGFFLMFTYMYGVAHRYNKITPHKNVHISILQSGMTSQTFRGWNSTPDWRVETTKAKICCSHSLKKTITPQKFNIDTKHGLKRSQPSFWVSMLVFKGVDRSTSTYILIAGQLSTWNSNIFWMEMVMSKHFFQGLIHPPTEPTIKKWLFRVSVPGRFHVASI